jgi:hypothetical protein
MGVLDENGTSNFLGNILPYFETFLKYHANLSTRMTSIPVNQRILMTIFSILEVVCNRSDGQKNYFIKSSLNAGSWVGWKFMYLVYT